VELGVACSNHSAAEKTRPIKKLDRKLMIEIKIPLTEEDMPQKKDEREWR